MPARQAEQADAAAEVNLPATQLEQAIKPVVAAYVPVPQELQLVTPVVAEKVPVTQLKQADAPVAEE